MNNIELYLRQPLSTCEYMSLLNTLNFRNNTICNLTRINNHAHVLYGYKSS